MSAGDFILLVEDNPDDVFIFKRALKKALVVNPVVVVTDGQAAVDYLSAGGGRVDQADHALPLILFLDLKLPYRDGFEVLAWIRSQPALQSLAVIVLSGSDEPTDHRRAYSLGARSYLVKPPKPEEISQLLQSMASHWGRIQGSGPVLADNGNEGS